jgi:hypothetical protein
MDHPFGMGVAHGIADLVEYVHQSSEIPTVFCGEPTLLVNRTVDILDGLGEFPALDLTHGEIESVIGQLAHFVD